jgi:hypothetical protein
MRFVDVELLGEVSGLGDDVIVQERDVDNRQRQECCAVSHGVACVGLRA